jgi:hypothetical protein
VDMVKDRDQALRSAGRRYRAAFEALNKDVGDEAIAREYLAAALEFEIHKDAMRLLMAALDAGMQPDSFYIVGAVAEQAPHRRANIFDRVETAHALDPQGLPLCGAPADRLLVIHVDWQGPLPLRRCSVCAREAPPWHREGHVMSVRDALEASGADRIVMGSRGRHRR